MIEFQVRHTAEGLRRIYTEWWRQRFGVAYGIAFVLAVAAFTALLTLRAAPWWLVSGTTLAVTYAAFLTTVRDTAIRLGLKHLEILGDGGLRYELDETGMKEISANGRHEIHWRVFDSVKRLPSALLVFRKPEESQTFVVLPLSQIPADAEAFIRARLGS